MTAFAALAGCTGEELARRDDAPAAEGKPVRVMLNLSVAITGVPDVRTRAAGEEVTTPGTPEESAVKSLTVFVVNVDGNGYEAMTAQHATFRFDWDGSGTGTPDPMPLQATTGRKHIYIGANLTAWQIAAFAGETGNGVNAAYTGQTGTDYDDYDEMMAEFTEDGGFAMLGRATAGGSELIDIPDEPTPFLDLSVELSRMVAKVLVVAETDDDIHGGTAGVKYVKISNGNEADASEKNWVRLDDLHFTLNVTNRRTFMYPKTAEEEGRTVILDPNYKFEDLVDFTDGVFKYKSDDHSRQFIRWVPHVWNTDKEWGMPVLEYEAGRMPASGGSEIYREGLYCLENTVGSIPADWAAAPALADNERGLTFMATTYVLIAARITPRWIITKLEEDPAIRPDGRGPYKAETEEDALSKLPASNDEHDEHPAGTFYSPDREHFYSYDGMMARIAHDEPLEENDPDKLTRENFLCYPGGWGYYFTYADGVPDEVNGGNSLKFDSDRSSVLRNHYYILHVMALGTPAFPGEGGVTTMQIEASRFGWTDAGTGDITLKP